MIETAIWWTGACVLSAGALLAVVVLFAAIVGATTILARYYGERAWNVSTNLYFMHEWRRAGCPRWYFEDGQPTQMRPTKDQ